MNGIYDTDTWISVPMVSDEAVAEGFAGGEGCRQILCPVLDPVQGKYGFIGTDIGGLYRTDDGGITWSVATLGLDSAGATGAAFDPNNINRCIVVGANSAAQEINGLFLSTDCGKSWKPVLRACTCNRRAFNTQVAFDPTSYDEELGYSRVVYWSREDNDSYRYAVNEPAIYRSCDGGETFERMPGSEMCGGADLAVHSRDGRLVAACKHGVYRSCDRGKTFEKLLDVCSLSMSSVSTHPDMLWVSTKEGMYISEDFGDSFYLLRGAGYPEVKPSCLRVSPADITRMVIQDDHSESADDCYGHVTMWSHDGGKSWHSAVQHKDIKNPAWCAQNSAINGFCWHPSDKNRVLCCWTSMYASDDGGKNYYYSSTGFSGLSGTGLMRFNINNSDLIAMSSSDYNGAVSHNGGKTWKYINWSGYSWGGCIIGTYCMSENVIIAAERNSRTHKNNLIITYDGGKTVAKTNIILKGPPVSFGAVGNNDIAFMGEWRTCDGAHTWKMMSGCSGVYCADKNRKMLFGKNFDGDIAVSSDNGSSWSVLAHFDGNILDMAFNSKRKVLFVADGERVYYINESSSDRTPKVLSGFEYGRLAKGVCVDPANPDVMYISCKSDQTYQNRNIWRSTDAGKSFVCLTRQVGDGREGPDGARRPTCITVNEKTHELFVFTCGKGTWKTAPPKGMF